MTLGHDIRESTPQSHVLAPLTLSSSRLRPPCSVASQEGDAGKHGTRSDRSVDVDKACHSAVARSIIIHAGCIAAGVGRAISRVCLFVRALKGKRLELSTPNFLHIYSILVARYVLTQRSISQRPKSHGYKERHGRTVVSDACCYGHVLLLSA